MQVKFDQIEATTTDQSLAAAELRSARAEYRRALTACDLPAALRARRKITEAKILLDVVRFIVEGDV
jgi:hypothetical protein